MRKAITALEWMVGGVSVVLFMAFVGYGAILIGRFAL